MGQRLIRDSLESIYLHSNFMHDSKLYIKVITCRQILILIIFLFKFVDNFSKILLPNNCAFQSSITHDLINVFDYSLNIFKRTHSVLYFHLNGLVTLLKPLLIRSPRVLIVGHIVSVWDLSRVS